ncbi:MAG: hypothetical protein KAS75_00335 [Planctomycetes bacterium]|nr:hypothetical protein [Planctomycetota bacterium]
MRIPVDIFSKDECNYHLRALMAIAQIAQEKGFERRWLGARDTEGIRNLILLSGTEDGYNSKTKMTLEIFSVDI